MQGANKFGIYALVEVLPTLLLSSVMLFFAGLVVFAFRANPVVAYVTLAVVAFRSLSYIALTLLPFVFPNCPYQTPLTTIIWYGAQIILLLLSYTAHSCAKGLHKWEKLQDTLTETKVESLLRWHKTNVKCISEGIFSKFENSARFTSMDIYRKALLWMLSLLDEDSELEEFVSGIPGLCESKALASCDSDNDPQGTIGAVLAILPGPTSFHAPFSWSIIHLADRAITSDLSEPIRRQRIKACLKALYYIPGAIRDLLAPYAAGKHYCLAIIPLLNSIESLEVIEELWDTPGDDVALSVRCAAAVVYSFMITPSRSLLETRSPPKIRFIGDTQAGKEFLSKRLACARIAINPNADLHSDSARLQNLARFLEDLKTSLGYNVPLGSPGIAQSILKERLALFEARNPAKYRAGDDISEQHGNRKSPAFIPAALQDLIMLTFEILTREPLADAEPLQRQAFLDAYTEILEVACTTQMSSQTPDLSLAQFLANFLVPSLLLPWENSLLRPLIQDLRLLLSHPLAHSRISPQLRAPAHALLQSLEQPQVRALAHALLQSLGQQRAMALLHALLPAFAPFLPQRQTSQLLQLLPQFLARHFAPSQPQWPLRVQAPPEPPSANIQAVGDVEMATIVPQQVAQDVDVRPQTEGRPTVHYGSFPSTTAIPRTASAGPSYSASSVASSSSSLLPTTDPRDRAFSDLAGALV